MKKIGVFVLALMLIAGLAGCDKKTISDDWTDLDFLVDGEKYPFSVVVP
ncbi:MAG: hypothetical protein ACOX1F_00030 [Erysipelotrichaceae bacterium]